MGLEALMGIASMALGIAGQSAQASAAQAQMKAQQEAELARGRATQAAEQQKALSEAEKRKDLLAKHQARQASFGLTGGVTGAEQAANIAGWTGPDVAAWGAGTNKSFADYNAAALGYQAKASQNALPFQIGKTIVGGLMPMFNSYGYGGSQSGVNF